MAQGAHRSWLEESRFGEASLPTARTLARARARAGSGVCRGSEWQEELRRRAVSAAQASAQRRGLSPPLLASWTYECAAPLRTLRPGRVSAGESRRGAEPCNFVSGRSLDPGPLPPANLSVHGAASPGLPASPDGDARSHAPLRLSAGAFGR